MAIGTSRKQVAMALSGNQPGLKGQIPVSPKYARTFIGGIERSQAPQRDEQIPGPYAVRWTLSCIKDMMGLEGLSLHSKHLHHNTCSTCAGKHHNILPECRHLTTNGLHSLFTEHFTWLVFEVGPTFIHIQSVYLATS